MVVYGGFALFWAHPGVSLLSVGSPVVAAFPRADARRVAAPREPLPRSTLVSPVDAVLRGQLGLFRLAVSGASRTRSSSASRRARAGSTISSPPSTTDPRPWAYSARSWAFASCISMVGRCALSLVPKAVDRLEDYEWVDGEVVAGLALGWNFRGKGTCTRSSCSAPCPGAVRSFEPGELRCIFVESQPLGRRSLAYRIVDASTGEIERGKAARRGASAPGSRGAFAA